MMRWLSILVLALAGTTACTMNDLPEEETTATEAAIGVPLCAGPYTSPAFTRPADDGVALSTLIEGAGYGASTNSGWVDIASGNLCGGAEKELLLLKNTHSDFSVMRGPTPFAVAGFDFISDAAHPWRAVAIGNLDADPLDEIVAVRTLGFDGVSDVIVAKANPTSCVITTPLAQAQIAPASNSDWLDVAVGNFDGTGKKIALLRSGGPVLTLVKLSGGALTTVTTSSLGSLASFPWRQIAAGDLDGDGIDELVAARQVNDAKTTTVVAFKLTRGVFTPFASSVIGNTGNALWTGLTVGDFNGDGRAAIALVKDAHASFIVLDLPVGGPTLRILRASDLDTASGQHWRGLTAVDWLGNDAGANELVAVRQAQSPYRADLFVYGNAFHRALRDSAISDVKAAFDQAVDGSDTALATDALIDALKKTHTNMLTWTITRADEYRKFVNFLDATKSLCIDNRQFRVGLDLVPPAAVDHGDPIQMVQDLSNTLVHELEQFQPGATDRQRAKDYRGWGKLLGALAQQYPHLVAVQIDDLMNHPDAFNEEEVAEMQANMRSRAPWMSFLGVTYSNNAGTVPDMARTIDTFVFYFRNDLGPPPSPPFPPDPQCIEGACGEQSVWHLPFEIAKVQSYMPAGRKLHLGSYWGSLVNHPEGTPRYDFDLMRLMLSLPNIGGVQQYPEVPAPPICNEFNFTSNKSCILARLYGGALRPITHADLTALSGANPAAGDPFGYVFPQAGLQNVVYRATDDHAHELWRTSSAIGHSDLTALAGAPAARGDVRAYVWNPAGTQNVVYVGTDWNVHALSWTTGAVGHDNLTALAGAPLSASMPWPYVDDSVGTQNVVYAGFDGHVHGLFWSFGAVGHDDLSGLAGAQNAAGNPFAYMYNGNVQNALYRATDGHLHGLWWSQGPVGHDDLSALAGAPGPAADARTYISTNDGLQHAVYAGTDGHVHELYWSFGAVGHDDLTSDTHAPSPASGATPAAFFLAGDGTQHVVYRDNLSHLRELTWTIGGVSDDDLSAVTNAPLPAGNPSAYIALDGSPRIVYRSSDGHIHELRH